MFWMTLPSLSDPIIQNCLSDITRPAFNTLCMVKLQVYIHVVFFVLSVFSLDLKTLASHTYVKTFTICTDQE